jgi:hypothetical protein
MFSQASLVVAHPSGVKGGADTADS